MLKNSVLLLFFSITAHTYEPQFAIKDPNIDQNFRNIAAELRHLNSETLTLSSGAVINNGNLVFSTTTSNFGIIFQDKTSMVSAGVGAIGISANTDQFTGNGTAGSLLTLLSSSVTLKGNTGFNLANWDTAYSWGNHAGLYLPVNTAISPALIDLSTITSVLNAHAAALSTAAYTVDDEVITGTWTFTSSFSVTTNDITLGNKIYISNDGVGINRLPIVGGVGIQGTLYTTSQISVESDGISVTNGNIHAVNGDFIGAFPRIDSALSTAAYRASTQTFTGLNTFNNGVRIGNPYYTEIGGSVAQLDYIDYTLPYSTDGVEGFFLQYNDGQLSWQLPPVTSDETFFFTDDMADIDAYYAMYSTLTLVQTTTVPVTTKLTSLVVISTWTTISGYPSGSFLPNGSWIVRVYASVDDDGPSTQECRLWGRFYKCNTLAGDCTDKANWGLIGETALSPVLSETVEGYRMILSTGTITLIAGDRILVEGMYTTSGSGVAPVLSVYFGGVYDSHMEIPTQSASVANFVPYNGATKNINTGIYSVAVGSITGYGGGLTGVITSTAAIVTALSTSTERVEAVAVSTGVLWASMSTTTAQMINLNTYALSTGSALGYDQLKGTNTWTGTQDFQTATSTSICLGGVCNESWPASSAGDNFGNHIATQTVDLQANQITGTGPITIGSATINGDIEMVDNSPRFYLRTPTRDLLVVQNNASKGNLILHDDGNNPYIFFTADDTKSSRIKSNLMLGTSAGETGYALDVTGGAIITSSVTIGEQLIVGGTATITGSAFSVGGSTLVVSNGEVVVNGSDYSVTRSIAFKENTGISVFGSTIIINGSINFHRNSNSIGIGNYTLQASTMQNLYNIAIGDQALMANTTGQENTCVGAVCLKRNTTGRLNVGLGSDALTMNTSGNFNTAFGWASLFWNNGGNFNTALGNQSLTNNISGEQNTAVGMYSLLYTTFGYNTGMGYAAGYSNTTGTYNTFMGHFADTYRFNSGLTNATAIGKSAKVDCSNCMVLGGTGADAVNVGIGKILPTSALDVVGSIKENSYALEKQPVFISSYSVLVATGIQDLNAAFDETLYKELAIYFSVVVSSVTNVNAIQNGYQLYFNNDTFAVHYSSAGQTVQPTGTVLQIPAVANLNSLTAVGKIRIVRPMGTSVLLRQIDYGLSYGLYNTGNSYGNQHSGNGSMTTIDFTVTSMKLYSYYNGNIGIGSYFAVYGIPK